MDYEQILAQYEDALDTILELELQIWELCYQNSQLRHSLNGLDLTDTHRKQIRISDEQDCS